MSKQLAGHLDDLDLDEVVRVIALSRRSGILTVESTEGNAEITFLLGRTVRARLHDATETVGDLLVRAAVLLPGHLTGDDAQALMLDDVVRAAADPTGRTALLARADDVIAEHIRALAQRVMLFRTGS